MSRFANSGAGASLAVGSPREGHVDAYLDSEGDEEYSEIEEGKRGSGSSSNSAWSRPASGKFLQAKLKQARSFSFFSSSKRAQQDSGLEGVEHQHVETDDDHGSDEETDEFESTPRAHASGKSHKGRTARMTATERRSLTHKSAKKLGLTLDGEEIETTGRRKRSSFRRRSSGYF
ncbi:Hypothetical Protein FCC1311_068942 [Hondaea fermentalgiana]|uniref:Uncharacterized protein n=1 Tax=Hondaea fermentalgiana TaxID=2315210 RepID=A0A2R5GS19_9STRA|nr:Hypothetical Protein FCC1311_068942 [Hondaea fermentalgiana]|eukprot:GBG30674.1 Hypothetical Protein FCC1311_068942 [Hondaea fermentalgiana]